jgi:hypothetical protein
MGGAFVVILSRPKNGCKKEHQGKSVMTAISVKALHEDAMSGRKDGQSFLKTWDATLTSKTKLRSEVVEEELFDFLLEEAKGGNENAWAKVFRLIKEGEKNRIIGSQGRACARPVFFEHLKNKFGSLDEAVGLMLESKSPKEVIQESGWLLEWLAQWGMSESFQVWMKKSKLCGAGHQERWLEAVMVLLETSLISDHHDWVGLWMKKIVAYRVLDCEEWRYLDSSVPENLDHIGLDKLVEWCVLRALETGEKKIEPLMRNQKSRVHRVIKEHLNEVLGVSTFKTKLTLNQINQCAKKWEVPTKEMRGWVHTHFFDKVRWTHLNSSLIGCAESLIEEFGCFQVQEKKGSSEASEIIGGEIEKRYQAWLNARQESGLVFQRRWFEPKDLKVIEKMVNGIHYLNETIGQAQQVKNQKSFLIERVSLKESEQKKAPRKTAL